MGSPFGGNSFKDLGTSLFSRNSSIERVALGARLILGLSIIVLLFLIGHSIFSFAFLSGDSTADFANNVDKSISVAHSGDAIPTPDSQSDYSLVAKRNIFGKLTKRETSVKTNNKVEKPVSNVALTLIGTFISKGSDPYAIIEDKKKKSQEVFDIKDSVFGVATLEAINPTNVEIRRNGQVEILNLDDAPDEPSSSTGGDPDVEEEQFTVDEAELDSALENLPLLLTQARAIPFFKNGKSVGLRLFAIKNGSLFEKIGLKNGDILKTINGNSLGDITQAVKLFEKLKEERTIMVGLERGKKSRSFKYEIQ